MGTKETTAPALAAAVPETAPAPLEEIELLEPHEHAGRTYPAGGRLNLALHKLDLDSAAWLIGLGKAKQVPATLNPTPAQPE